MISFVALRVAQNSGLSRGQTSSEFLLALRIHFYMEPAFKIGQRGALELREANPMLLNY